MWDDLLLSPFVFTADLILFFGSEIILDVEGLANLFRRLALDHICDGFAADIKECLDIKVVGSLCDTDNQNVRHLE